MKYFPPLFLAAAFGSLATPAAATDTPTETPRRVDFSPAFVSNDEGPRKVTRLGEYGQTRVMQLQLKAGAELSSHSAPERVLVIVLDGNGRFEFDGETVPLQSRQMLHMTPGEPHAVIAETDLDLLLVRIGE